MLGGCAGVKLHVPDGTIIDIICGDHRNADVFECNGGEKVQLVADVVDVVWVALFAMIYLSLGLDCKFWFLYVH